MASPGRPVDFSLRVDLGLWRDLGLDLAFWRDLVHSLDPALALGARTNPLRIVQGGIADFGVLEDLTQ